MGYDSVLREYRDGYRDQIFLISACIQNLEYLDCDFVGVRMVFRMGVEKHALNVRCSGVLKR